MELRIFNLNGVKKKQSIFLGSYHIAALYNMKEMLSMSTMWTFQLSLSRFPGPTTHVPVQYRPGSLTHLVVNFAL